MRGVEDVILVLLVVDADDVDRIGDAELFRQTTVHRRRYRTAGVQALDCRTHAPDHLIALLGRLHGLFVEYRPQIDAWVISVAAYQPAQLRQVII